MVDAIEYIIFSRLSGQVGASPELVAIYPKEFDVPDEIIIEKTLPFGSKLNEFYEYKIQEHAALVYLFKIDNVDARADFASISMIYTQEANTFLLRDAMVDLFEFLHENEILSVEILKNNLSTIMNSLNARSKIEFKGSKETKKKSYTFDLPKYLKKRGYTILKKVDTFFDTI